MPENVAVTAIEIRAIDQASAVFRQVAGNMDSLSSVANTAKAVLGSLGAALSVGAVIEWGRGVVDAAASLTKWSQETGSSIENLSRLQNQAKVSGVEFETLRTLVDRLAVGMAGADDKSSSVGRALKFLGVTAKDPAEALEQIAIAMDRYADGTGKAALAKDLFQKGGPQLLSMLHDMAEAHGVAATVTKEQADQAELLQQQLARLSIEAGSFRNAVLSDIVPAINDMIAAFREGRTAGMDFGDALHFALKTPVVGFSKEELDARVSGLQQQIAEYKRLAAEARESLASWDIEANTRILLENQLKGFLAKIDVASQELKAFQQLQLKADVASVYGPNFVLPKPQAGYKPPGGDVKTQRDAYAELVAQLERAMLATDGLTKSEEIELALKRDKLPPAQERHLRFLADAVDMMKQEKDEREASAKSADAVAKLLAKSDEVEYEWRKKLDEEYDRSNEAVKELVEQAEFEVQALQMTNKERETAIALRQLEKDGIHLSAEELENYRERLKAAIEQKESMQEHIDAWKTIEETAHSTFTHIFEGGKDVFERLTDVLKSTLLELLYQLTIKKWIISIGTSISGSVAGSATGSAVGQALGGGGGNLAGGFLGNLLGFGGGSMGGAFMEGMMSPVSTLGSIFDVFATGAEFASPGLALASGLGAVAPWVAGGLLIASLFGGKGGGPKSGGFATLGNVTGLTADNASGRWFTPNQADTTLQQTLATIQNSYSSFLERVGGVGSAGFAMGYDTDPQGTAANRLRAGVYQGGQQIYYAGLEDLGRDQAALEAAMKTESARMLLAAIQASDMPDRIAKIVNSISATTASEADVNKILSLAAAWGDLNKIITSVQAGKPLDDALHSVASQAKGAVGAFEDQATALRRLIDIYDGSEAATQALGAATTSYYQSLVQALAQIEQIKQSIDSMFSDTIRSMRLQTAGGPEQQYAFLMNEAQQLEAQMLASTNPAEIQTLTAQINANLNQAFGLLDPAAQRQALPSFITTINRINNEAATRLRDIGDDISEGAADTFAEIGVKLDGIADTMVGAANTQQTAANTGLASSQIFANAVGSYAPKRQSETNFG